MYISLVLQLFNKKSHQPQKILSVCFSHSLPCGPHENDLRSGLRQTRWLQQSKQNIRDEAPKDRDQQSGPTCRGCKMMLRTWMQREEEKDRSVKVIVALRVTEAGSQRRRLSRPDGNTKHRASELLLGLSNISLMYFCFITVLSDHTPQTM